MAARASNRTIKGLGIQYYLWGESPVQAFGEVRGRQFYFRADHDEWEIRVAERDDVLSPTGSETDYVLRGKRSEAGRMPHAEAALLIESFIRDYYAATD